MNLSLSLRKPFSHNLPCHFEDLREFLLTLCHTCRPWGEAPRRRLVYPMVFTLDGDYYSSTRFPLSVWIAKNRRASSDGRPNCEWRAMRNLLCLHLFTWRGCHGVGVRRERTARCVSIDRYQWRPLSISEGVSRSPLSSTIADYEIEIFGLIWTDWD